MGRGKHRKGKYRWKAFTHWLNMGAMVAGGAAAVALGPLALLALVPIEAGVLWVVPDLPGFRKATDEALDQEELMQEREYYMDQLWGLRPQRPKGFGQKLKGLFVTTPTVDLEDRVMNRKDPSFRHYMEMKGIIAKLHELEQLRGVSIPERQFARFEMVINSYLRIVIACRAIGSALQASNASQLKRELAEVEDKLSAGPRGELRAVLLERQRLLKARLAKLPKLQATLELFRTRADTIVYQMQNIHSQVLADPGMNVTSFLEQVVERHEMLVDPIGTLEADHLLEGVLDPAAVMQLQQQRTSE